MEEKTNPTSEVNLKKTQTPASVPEVTKTEEKPVESIETQEQINWRKFREIREKERKEKDESDRRANEKEQEAKALKEALEAVLNKSPMHSNQSSSNDSEEEDEIQKRINQALEKRDQENEKKRIDRERIDEPNKIRKTFPDFDQVCCQSNVDYLEYHHPELFESMKRTPDSFEKWSRVYNAMKRYIPNVEASKEAAKAEKNLKKPQSMSTGLTATGDSQPIMGLTEDRKRDNFARMTRIMKGLE